MTTQPTNQFPPEFYTPEFWQQYPKAKYAYAHQFAHWILCEYAPVYSPTTQEYTAYDSYDAILQKSFDVEGAIYMAMFGEWDNPLLKLEHWQGKLCDSLFVNPFIDTL